MNQLLLLSLLSHFWSGEIKTLMPLLHILPVSFQSLVLLMTNAVSTAASEWMEQWLESHNIRCRLIIRRGASACEGHAFNLNVASEEGRDAAGEALEIHSEEWLSEFGCRSDVMRNLLVKQITPRCLIFLLCFLVSQKLFFHTSPFILLQNTLYLVFAWVLKLKVIRPNIFMLN